MARGASARKRTAVSYKEQVDSEDEQEDQVIAPSRDPQANSDGYEDEDDGDDYEQAKKQKKGKGKATSRKPTGRKGRLSGMKDLPLDIWLIVAEHLDPLSLLHMSRASKALRQVFTSRRAKPLWSTVIAAAHLPELEDSPGGGGSFTEMAMISLIYEKKCHVCGKARASLVDYTLRIRWCSKCRKEGLMRDIWIRIDFPSNSVHVLQCVTPTIENRANRGGYKTFVHKAEVRAINDKLLELESQLRSVSSDEDKRDAQWELDDYVEERKAYVASAVELGQKLTRWNNQSANDRSAAAAIVKRARRLEIEKRLRNLGYSNQEIFGLWDHRSTIDQPTALTESIWSRISPVLIGKCEQLRRARLEGEALHRSTHRRVLLRPRYDALLKAEPDDSQKTFPSFPIFTDLPAVREHWKEEDASVTDENWNDSLEDIKRQIFAAKRWIKLSYAKLYVETRAGIGHTLPDSIVTSIIPPDYVAPPCTAYKTSIGWPNYAVEGDTGLDIEHPATISEVDLDELLARPTCTFLVNENRQRLPLGYPQAYTLSHDEYYISPQKTSVNKEWIKALVEVLESTGIDDGPLAWDQLEKLGPHFSCRGCHNALAGVRVWIQGVMTEPAKPDKTSGMFWSELISHVGKFHSNIFCTRYRDLKPSPSFHLDGEADDEKPEVNHNGHEGEEQE